MEEEHIIARFAIRYAAFSLNLDLRLPGKGVTVLFGRSGSGKTTCLRAMAGLEKLSQGYFSVAGEVWQDSEQGRFVPTYQRNIGYVFQEAGLFPHLSVRSNLEYGLKRVEPARRKVDMLSVCRLLGIDHLLERSPAGLSGGERQRIAMARALLTSPDILLMDEPLSALDNGLKAEILPYLEKLHCELSIPVIYVTHSVEELARLADHIVLFDKGNIIASGQAFGIMSDPAYQGLFGDGLGSVIDTRVAGHSADHMTCLSAGDGVDFYVPEYCGEVGEQHRCRILASDISVCLTRPLDSSILNEVPATIMEINPATRPGEMTLVLEAGNGVRLLSLITERSLQQLSLSQGMPVWAQIKSVAIC